MSDTPRIDALFAEYHDVGNKNLLETEVRKLELELSASQSRVRELEEMTNKQAVTISRLKYELKEAHAALDEQGGGE